MDNVTFVRGSQGPQFWIQEPSQIPQPRMPRTKALSSLSFGPIRIQGRRNSSPPLSRNDSILWSDFLVRLPRVLVHRVLEAVSKSVVGAIGVATQRQETGELSHGSVRMFVIDGIDPFTCRGAVASSNSHCENTR